ncbi:Ubiquitin-fold modifier-conjugating enzyme 1 [Hondaea fermentalgiana]|uniref:Ubiquitin-fold modifier-conjugating enzyme 1 n=1 Tax=Hondaea fermentalgiana TaxID=2315210 RepID=A0A2R5GFQ5_9STRA|nr:Ubiquitin-fold modifier-conjugating enzyme 1 [Hondaea fermentalgiana]|eukprot:GBG29415.1 Ubiquitin-fold modifier-conjugating enzyme 1 [Hondaea fermentalgiana]
MAELVAAGATATAAGAAGATATSSPSETQDQARREDADVAGIKNKAKPAFDDSTRQTVRKLPLLKARAGPRDAQDVWKERLKEEYVCLIEYVKINKERDSDWFSLKANSEGTSWSGTCWHYHENLRYEFKVIIELPVGYPLTPPEIKIPELNKKTIKMYHGGKICLDVHFNPLWTKNVPRFGVAHALALGLGPWLAAEVPNLVQNGFVSAV